MPPAEAAAAILPWFSSHKALIDERVMTSIAGWLKTGSDREARSHTEHDSAAFKDPDVRAVAEAIQVLEHASLLIAGSWERRINPAGLACAPGKHRAPASRPRRRSTSAFKLTFSN
jgi:hypothetical protein